MASETNETREKSLNFLEEIIEESIAKGETRVQTRFPPEPNGYLHIGHAKSICINFGLAKKYGGKCNLRFDDTNPVKEDVEYVDSIKRDIQWLGFDWAVERYASDYFDQLYDWAIVLIKKGLAYVDDQTQEQIRENRGTVSVPGTPSPWRDRSVEENLDLFERMKKGEFADGEKVLRAKIDMAHPNMLFRDPIMYRILHAEHHRTGNKWCIYPMYDYAHGQCDSIERITHSICTLEFDVHRPLYDWFIQALDIYPSHQYEFARLNLTYTMMSKRRLLKLVQEGAVMGWDDPRMPTICALRRKGYTPASVRNFAEMVGVAKRDNVIDLGKLEFCVREDLNKVAERRMAVLNPLKVVITNYPEGKTKLFTAINNPEDENAGTRQVPFSREIYIERDDFMEVPPKKYYRLSPGTEVRLRYSYLIRCEEVVKDAEGNITELRAFIEATLDFPEEDIDVIGSEKVRTRLVQAETGIRAILENARQGQVLREGVTVAIVGSPNVGKSSLLNALAQEEVAIVTDIPGTTRDRIEHWVSLNGVPVKMVDTAGIRTTDDVVESKGIERTLVEIRKADVVLHLKDASGLIRDDTEVLDKVLKEVRHGVPLITVNNKVDLCESAASGGEIAISAKQGVGLSELKARLLEVVGMAATTDGVFMARERHLQCLKTAAEHVSRALLLIDCDPMPELVAEELRLASRALGEILGETTTEDILGMIFSKFCIGK